MGACHEQHSNAATHGHAAVLAHVCMHPQPHTATYLRTHTHTQIHARAHAYTRRHAYEKKGSSTAKAHRRLAPPNYLTTLRIEECPKYVVHGQDPFPSACTCACITVCRHAEGRTHSWHVRSLIGMASIARPSGPSFRPGDLLRMYNC